MADYQGEPMLILAQMGAWPVFLMRTRRSHGPTGRHPGPVLQPPRASLGVNGRCAMRPCPLAPLDAVCGAAPPGGVVQTRALTARRGGGGSGTPRTSAPP